MKNKLFVCSKVKNLENKVKDDINLYFCNKITEHYNKEKKKLKFNHGHVTNENGVL